MSDLTDLNLLALFLAGDGKLGAKPRLKEIVAAPLSSYGPVVKMGVPASLEDLLWNIGNLILISFLNAPDPLATAVYSLVFTIEILPIVLFLALGQTTTVTPDLLLHIHSPLG